ncbi:MAG: helix-turn-helix domain-containing protein [Actinomycetota bacterium]|nr:helix-turn-helix domain-containing protein [Actinomycetota bacterium]
MTGPEPGSGPTVLRILLGSQLRQLREAKNISREDAGYTIRASESKISRMELGRVGFKERDVADLLILYGVTKPEDRDALLTLVDEANAPGWWHRYNDVLPGWFTSYVGLEAAAALIRSYEVQFVPGLLQTEEYARAVMEVGVERLSREEIRQRIKLRQTRQQILNKQHPVRFWGVIDEAALRRPIGGRDVMRAQLEHLITLTKAPNVTLQIIPFGAGGHAASAGAFSILRFPDQHMPDVVYTEQVTSALYLDKRDDVDRYQQVIERLCMEADPPAQTVDTLTGILTETVAGR